MERDNGKYLSLKEAVIEIRADLRVVKNMLEKGEKKFEDCNKNINAIVRLNLKDKESIKQWSEEKFVTKRCFEPIKKVYNSLAATGIGVLVLIGTVGLSIFMFFKDKILK